MLWGRDRGRPAYRQAGVRTKLSTLFEELREFFMKTSREIVIPTT